MRFIARDERTERHLEGHDLISQPREIITVRHFFHNRGTVLQKSFEGILRNILYQIVDAAPKLAPPLKSILEENTPRKASGPWNSHLLRKCLHQILQQSTYDVRLFILLDALDEYDGTPEYISVFLSDLLRSAGSKTQVKILFSSRPWETFREHFKDASGLRLQDHNKTDIRLYCENKIHEQDPTFRPMIQPLVPEIVRRANGVFIWVKYILQDLCRAAAERGGKQDLSRTLETLSTDLNEYYTSVIRRIDRRDRPDAFALFQLVASRTDGLNFDTMDFIFAHSVWNCENYEEAQKAFDVLMQSLIPDSVRIRFVAGTKFTNTLQREHQFVRPRLVINRYGLPEGFECQEKKFARLSGGLVLLTKPTRSSQPKDLSKRGLEDLTRRNVLPRRTAIAMKPLFTKFNEEDVEPFYLEPSHQTVYDFIKGPGFKDQVLANHASLIHENRYTWLTKMFLAQKALQSAGEAAVLTEITTGRSMRKFIDSVPRKAWKEMYETDTLDILKNPEGTIDSPMRFAVVYGLKLYVEDVLEQDADAVKNTDEEFVLVPPEGYDAHVEDLPDGHWRLVIEEDIFLQRHIDMMRLLVRGGYCPQKTREAYRKILWILGARTIEDFMYIRGRLFESWPARATEIKAAALMELGQDPDIQLSGIKARLSEGERNPEVKWRPIHIASLRFTKMLSAASADLNGEDGCGNTALDWLLAPWDTSGGRKSRGLAHRLIEKVFPEVVRDRWGKIAYLVEHGGVAKTTTASVWQAFLSRRAGDLQTQSVSIARRPFFVTAKPGVDDISLLAGETLRSETTSRTATVTGFADVVSRREADDIVTYTNLGDDGNLLDSYFKDIHHAQAKLSELAFESRAMEAVKRERPLLSWRSRR